MPTGIVHRYTFTKEERLCLKKDIDELFTSGQSFISYPLRVVYSVQNDANVDQPKASILISVAKKKLKRAVARNRIKRLVREAYRLNNSPLIEILQPQHRKVNIAFLYLKDSLSTYSEIEKAMLKTMTVLQEKLGEGNE